MWQIRLGVSKTMLKEMNGEGGVLWGGMGLPTDCCGRVLGCHLTEAVCERCQWRNITQSALISKVWKKEASKLVSTAYNDDVD